MNYPHQKTQRYDVLEVFGDSSRNIGLEVCKENSVNIILNDETIISHLTIPGDLKALAYGFLLCEGFIESPEDIFSVDLKDNDIIVRSKSSSKVIRMRPDDLKVDIRTLYQCYMHTESLADITKKTGGTHCCALYTQYGGLVSFAEDISRHNAMDRVVGKAVLEGYGIEGVFLFCTGRPAEKTVLKAANTGIPLIVSTASASGSAISAARELGITLASFVRFPVLSIYSHNDRIMVDTLQIHERENYASPCR